MPSPVPYRVQLLQLARGLGGFITAQEAREAGIPQIELTRSTREGKLLRIERGLYQLSHSADLAPAPAEALDLLEVQLRSPYARPCLVSALHLHGLTTTRPTQLQFAVPKNRQRLPTEPFPTDTFYFGPAAYDAGLLAFPVRERFLTTYSVEKTLVDLLRYAPKLGRELYLEGLKNALRRKQLDQRELLKLAKAFRVYKTLSQDLEVLSHDQDRLLP